jgi:NTP pyrophosphatase (non-canonical NTP hydrolase)
MTMLGREDRDAAGRPLGCAPGGKPYESEQPNYNKADEDPKPGDLRINDKGEFEAWVNSLGWIPANETQWSISMWAERTFGQLRNFNAVAIRTNLEMAELLRAADALDNAVRDGRQEDYGKLKAALAEEGADVIITMMRIFSTLGVDYRQEINKKMMINRKRKWALDGNGTGQHVRESRAPEPGFPPADSDSTHAFRAG